MADVDVIADDRERAGGAIRALRSMDGVSVRVERMALGDYLVDRRLLFERKTIQDLVVSLADGRLFRQACRMRSRSYRPVYVIEGSGSDLAGGSMRREALQGAIVMLSVVLGIPVLRSLDTKETARLIVYASRQARRSIRGAVQRPGSRPRGVRKRRLYVLQGLPGIGPERAERLLDTFGSLESIFGADEMELAEVEGIGDKTARRIRNLVGGIVIPQPRTRP